MIKNPFNFEGFKYKVKKNKQKMNRYVKSQIVRLNNIKKLYWESINENNKFTKGKNSVVNFRF